MITTDVSASARLAFPASGPFSGISTPPTSCSTSHGRASSLAFASMSFALPSATAPGFACPRVAAVTVHQVRPGLLCLPSLSVPSYLPSPSSTNYMGRPTHKAGWRSGPGNSFLTQAPEASSTCRFALSFTSLLLHSYQWLPNSGKGPNPMSASQTVPIAHSASSLAQLTQGRTLSLSSRRCGMHTFSSGPSFPKR